MQELTYLALFLSIFGLLIAVSVLSSRAIERLGVPLVLAFLVLGMLGGSEGIGGIAFENYEFAFLAGNIALILILFEGGLNTSLQTVRQSLGPSIVLSTVGVAATAGLVAVCGRAMGLAWPTALLIGAIVSSTDVAAVLSVLRGGGMTVKRRVAEILELESGINDPMAIMLTLAMMQVFSDSRPPALHVLGGVGLQLIVGLTVGLIIGFATRWSMSRLRLSAGGLYPALTLASGFVAFGIATLIEGSGYLAVFVAALIIGNSRLPYQNGIRRIHEAIAWICQISMFLMLGLLVFPSRLLPFIGFGLGLSLALAFIIRPLVVFACLWPFRLPWKESLFIGLVGLRGAVPIVLALFPVLASIPNATDVFNLVFFLVVVNAIVPGAFVRWLMRKLDLSCQSSHVSKIAIEIHSTRLLRGDIMSFLITPELAVTGAMLSQIRFPEESAVILVVRGEALIAPRGTTQLTPGDFAYVFCRPEDRPYLELLFGHAGDDTAPSRLPQAINDTP